MRRGQCRAVPRPRRRGAAGRPAAPFVLTPCPPLPSGEGERMASFVSHVSVAQREILFASRGSCGDIRGIFGLKFRRQHVLHGFIVRFCCLSERIVIELEGDVHDRLETLLRKVLGLALSPPSPERRGGQGVRTERRGPGAASLSLLLHKSLESRGSSVPLRGDAIEVLPRQVESLRIEREDALTAPP